MADLKTLSRWPLAVNIGAQLIAGYAGFSFDRLAPFGWHLIEMTRLPSLDGLRPDVEGIRQLRQTPTFRLEPFFQFVQSQISFCRLRI